MSQTNHSPIRRLLNMVSSDLRAVRDINLFSTPQQFLVDLHACLFLSFLLISLPFFADLFLFDGVIARAVIEYPPLHINPAYLENIYEDQIELYFMLCFSAGGVATLASGLLFYALSGHVVRRSELLIPQDGSDILGSAKGVLKNTVGFVLLFLTAFIVGVHLPERFWLDRIPGFLVIQILLVAKFQALMFMSGAHILVLLLPYSLHPRKWLNRRS